jgi:[protein-PII] uridylyltransferase
VADIIKKALTGGLRLKDMMAQQNRGQSRLKAFTVPPHVVIDNESSNKTTVIEVNGLDRIGLLFDLTEALYRLNLNIVSAHITTFGEKAVDVFYVTDLTGAKITDVGRQARIKTHLIDILSPLAEPSNRLVKTANPA